MTSFFWTNPSPPPPAPKNDFGVLFVYCIYGYFVLMIIRGLSIDKKNKKKVDLLSDVIGLKGIKEELKYYMDFIKNKKNTQIGMLNYLKAFYLLVPREQEKRY